MTLRQGGGGGESEPTMGKHHNNLWDCSGWSPKKEFSSRFSMAICVRRLPKEVSLDIVVAVCGSSGRSGGLLLCWQVSSNDDLACNRFNRPTLARVCVFVIEWRDYKSLKMIHFMKVISKSIAWLHAGISMWVCFALRHVSLAFHYYSCAAERANKNC